MYLFKKKFSGENFPDEGDSVVEYNELLVVSYIKSTDKYFPEINCCNSHDDSWFQDIMVYCLLVCGYS